MRDLLVGCGCVRARTRCILVHFRFQVHSETRVDEVVHTHMPIASIFVLEAHVLCICIQDLHTCESSDVRMLSWRLRVHLDHKFVGLVVNESSVCCESQTPSLLTSIHLVVSLAFLSSLFSIL